MANLDPKKVIAYLANTKATDNESKIKTIRLIENLMANNDTTAVKFSQKLFEAIESLAAENLKIIETGITPAGTPQAKPLNEATAIKGRLIEIADNLIM